MTTETIQFPLLDDFNKWAYFWYHDVGMNIIPTDAEKKLPIVKWSQYQNESIPEELLTQWIHEERFKNGIGVITGKIWRGKHVGKYLTAVDLDNRLAIDEFSNYGGTEVCWQNITFVETRGDGKGKLHLYFISHEQIPDKQVDNAPEMIDKKDANLAPSIEVKGSCKKLIYPTPNRGYHPLSPIEIIDFSRSSSDLINHISEICQKYELKYIKDILAYDQCVQYNISNDVSLTDSDIQKIANLWVPYYKSGNRHDISVGTIGLYAKNGLTANTAKKLSLELSRITKDDQTRLIDVTATYSRLSQNKSIKSVALLEPIIGDDLPPILSKFQNILRCYRKEEQKIDLKLTHNDLNPELRLNEQQYNTAFTPDSGPMFNRAVENITSFGFKSDISNIKTQSSEAFRIQQSKPELEQNKGPAERLTSMLRHYIKVSFRDETDTAYVVIGDKHRQLICFDHDSFDEWAANLYEQWWNEVPSFSMIKNAKRVIRYSIKEQRSLHNRVAFTGDIWYDLHGKAVNVTSEKWEIVDDPCIFRNINSPQVQPIKPNNNRRYLKEIFSSCSIIHQYQRLILEVYTICLFIEGLQHPIILPNGVPGSGKSLLFEMLSLIVDPHKTLGGTSLKWLPKDEKDRRISIYSDYLSLFDNLSYVSSEAMDELCMWVTGYGKTERALFTNNKAISYSGKRPIGINGINIPIARADTLSRVFLLDLEKHPVGKSQSEVIANIKQLVPEILGHIFDILVIALKTYDEIRTKKKPNHRLGDFVIWGEVISRALGNNDNEFLKAWELNVKNQNQACGDSNPFIQLVIGFIYEQQNEIKLEPQILLKELKSFAISQGLDYNKPLPQDPSWLVRSLRLNRDALEEAGIFLDIARSHGRRYIKLKKGFSSDVN